MKDGKFLHQLSKYQIFKKDPKPIFPKCVTPTNGGTRCDFKGYATDNKLLKAVPEFYLILDEL
jgi:hypothetical protein